MCECVAKVAQRRRGHESPEGTVVGGSQGSLAASSAGQGPPPPPVGGGLGGAGALQVGILFSLHFMYSIFQCCGSGIRDPVPYFRELGNNFWVKILQIFDAVGSVVEP
jgi:hypothetical protein